MKLTSTSIILMALLPFGISSASAADFSVGGLYYQVLSESEKTVQVVKSDEGSYSGDITVPSVARFDGTDYTVEGIGDKAFYMNYGVKAISLPSTLKTIGNGAFYSTDIKTLNIPNSVTSIGDECMAGCIYLTEVHLPEGLTSLPGSIFQSCSALKTLELPANITSIPTWAFDCSGLETIVIPDAVETIMEGAFSSCGSLVNVTFGKSVNTIESDAFSYCESLVSVDLPASLKVISSTAFADCPALEAINIDKNNPYFASYAGAMYTPDLKTLLLGPCAMKHLEVPDETTEISSYSMASSMVESVTGCKNLLTVGDFAFMNCRNLTKVELGDKLTTLGEEAFSSTGIEYISLPASLEVLGQRAFNDCRDLKTLSVPDKVSDIGNYCFFGCRSVKDITLGTGTKYIGEYAFRNCDVLESITIKATTPPNCGDDFTEDQYANLILYVPQQSLDKYKNADTWKKFQNIKAMAEQPTLVLSVQNITKSGAEVTGKPSDAAIYWYTDVVAKADYTDTLCSELVEGWKAEGDNWYETYCGKAHTGEFTQSFSGLSDNTAYVAYGFAVDNTGKFCMPVTKVEFTTLTSGVEAVGNDAPQVYAANGTIRINGDFIKAVVYTAEGRIAGEFDGDTCNVVANGIYIVRIETAAGESAVKVIVK